jgi:hypothetical protein
MPQAQTQTHTPPKALVVTLEIAMKTITLYEVNLFFNLLSITTNAPSISNLLFPPGTYKIFNKHILGIFFWELVDNNQITVRVNFLDIYHSFPGLSITTMPENDVNVSQWEFSERTSWLKRVEVAIKEDKDKKIGHSLAAYAIGNMARETSKHGHEVQVNGLQTLLGTNLPIGSGMIITLAY